MANTLTHDCPSLNYFRLVFRLVFYAKCVLDGGPGVGGCAGNHTCCLDEQTKITWRTLGRKQKKCRAPFHAKASPKGFLFFLESEWYHIYFLRFQHHFWELKGPPPLPPSCPVPVPVLFLPLNGSVSPKAPHFSNSAQIVLVGLIKNPFLPYNSTLTIRVSLSQISILIRLWFRPAEWRLSSSTASVPAVAGLFPVQKSKRHIHRSATIFFPPLLSNQLPSKIIKSPQCRLRRVEGVVFYAFLLDLYWLLWAKVTITACAFEYWLLHFSRWDNFYMILISMTAIPLKKH